MQAQAGDGVGEVKRVQVGESDDLASGSVHTPGGGASVRRVRRWLPGRYRGDVRAVVVAAARARQGVPASRRRLGTSGSSSGSAPGFRISIVCSMGPDAPRACQRHDRRSRGASPRSHDDCTADEANQIASGAIGGSVGITFGQLWKGTKNFRRIS